MLSEGKNGGHDLGDCPQPQVGLLKADATGFKQNHGAGRQALLAVGTSQIKSGSHLLARNLSHAAALKCAFERNHHRCLSRDLSLHHHTAIVFLRGDVLDREPGRFNAIEGAHQLARCSLIEESRGPSPCVKFKKALPVEKSCSVSAGDHCSLTSTACSRRNITLPGVPPASLI